MGRGSTVKILLQNQPKIWTGPTHNIYCLYVCLIVQSLTQEWPASSSSLHFRIYCMVALTKHYISSLEAKGLRHFRLWSFVAIDLLFKKHFVLQWLNISLIKDTCLYLVLKQKVLNNERWLLSGYAMQVCLFQLLKTSGKYLTILKVMCLDSFLHVDFLSS